MNDELISVIIPVYNVELYLESCIQSICKQSYKNLEIILSDDGSTDHSGKICDKYASLDPRTKVIHKENGGLSDARNAGIEVASGQYFMFVDSDDTISKNTIEKMYFLAIEYQCEIVVCNMVRIYEDGTTESFYHPTDKINILKEQQRFETLNQPSVCNKLFFAELFNDVRFPKGKYYEDTFVYHILAYKAKRIGLTGHNGYFYLSRKESILGTSEYTDRYFDFIEAVYNRMIFLRKHNVFYYAEQAGLSLYVATAKGKKYLAKTKQNREKFKQMNQWYKEAYKFLIRSSEIGKKQKGKLVLLRYFPGIHNQLF